MGDANALIARPWFRAQAQATTMIFILPRSSHQERSFPLQPTERRLSWFVLPPFQRPAVWTEAQQVRFIESCWNGLPIGSFVYNRTVRDGPFDAWLLDGQQRIGAVLAYFSDAFPVMGYRYSELTKVDHRRFEMTVAFPALMTNLEDEASCAEVYDRLAYGGTPHEPKVSQ